MNMGHGSPSVYRSTAKLEYMRRVPAAERCCCEYYPETRLVSYRVALHEKEITYTCKYEFLDNIKVIDY